MKSAWKILKFLDAGDGYIELMDVTFLRCRLGRTGN
jgi:hypothetical protein